jgi:TolB-like protein/DNA-binding winged helix-turn-helix (wHTH) protein/Flp pilus assembly protein TadD
MESQRFRFGEFEADLRTGELRKNGSKIRLQEQPFQILASLLEQPGNVVTREELRKRLWPEGIHVDFENGLNIAVKKLRQALGDDSETPCFIQTLPRRGYRFIAPVEFGEPLPTDASAPRKPLGRNAIAAALAGIVAVLLIALGLRSWFFGNHNRPIPSIAVLPLLNMSGDPAQDYFADGMTEELITDLAGIRALRVISRTSSMLYKGAKKPVPQIGRELNADAIIEGAVIRSGSRVRITAQLVEAAKDKHLWAASYEEDLRDVLSVQDRVAREIADKVRAQLTPQETQRLTRPRTVNPRAYEAYLKGRYFAYKLSEDGIRKGEAYFRQAIAADPGYAQPYTGLAYVYLAQVGWTASAQDALPRAREAAEKAVRLDPALAEAHVDLGVVHFWYDWDWPSTEREFGRALALNPNGAPAHEWYGACLAWAGHSDEAISEGRKATLLDPVSTEASRTLGDIYYFSHRYGLAIAQLRDTLTMDNGYWFAHLSLGRALLQAGKARDSLAELETANRLFPDNPDPLSSLGNAYAVAGMKTHARDILARLQQLSHTRYVAPYQFAVIYTGLGDKARALDLLEKDHRERSMFVTWLRTDPALDSLRGEPRFQKLLSPLFAARR